MSMYNKPSWSDKRIRENTRIDFTADGVGRTKQSFAKEADINNILARYKKTGAISHLAKFEGSYGDATSIDLHAAMNTVKNAEDMFGELPAEIRREFDQDPGKFLDFVQNPDNSGKLAELLPALAARGTQLPALGGQAMITAMNELTEALGPATPAEDVVPEGT